MQFSGPAVAEHAQEIAAMMESRLGVRGQGLEGKLRRAGRLVPRRVRRDAAALVAATRLAENPKLMRRIDVAGVERAYRSCMVWLQSVDPRERRKDAILSFLAVNAVNFLLLATALIVWMVWTGVL